MALTREQRRAMLRSELDGESVEVTNVDAIDPVPAPVSAAAPAPIALTQDQFQALLSAIGGGGNIGTQIADAIQANRQPIPENTPDQYHARSIYHAEGKDAPREALKCEMWLGLWDHETGKAVRAYELHDALLTDAERAALNSLTPMQTTVTLTDGAQVPMRVVAQEDEMGALNRMVLAFPKSVYGKDQRNAIPPYVQLVGQLTTA